MDKIHFSYILIYRISARASLDILIPDLKNSEYQKLNRSESDLNVIIFEIDSLLVTNFLSIIEKFFDEINIEDQRINELCLKAGQYSPYQILVECIKRFDCENFMFALNK